MANFSQLDKSYNPKDFEDDIYKLWEEGGCFSPKASSDKEPFVIVIPPPNVTGVLHMGHGLNNSLQDILIRYYRMKGRPTLWVPGTDHAGIATQHVVEKRLHAQNIKKEDLGREEFLKRTWQVKDEHQAIIVKQLKKIGASCDWDSQRFTLDEGLSEAVKEVFVSLYERDLIYQGNYLVNWCSHCGTALADDEVEHEQNQGKLYHFKYPFKDGSGHIEIATTRPETMFGDTAVAVNPEDGRYASIIGKELVLPLTDRTIPLIADSYVDMEFGSGAVKITPAHDPNDWEVGNRHGLEKISIFTLDGHLNQNCPKELQGLTISDARVATVNMLKEQGYFLYEEDRLNQVGHCYRCNTVIEPTISRQWFVRMQPLAKKALAAWNNKEFDFYPAKWGNTYKHWLENIRDWCISRQLWWGHRIPVWYCNECDHIIVSRTTPTSCPKCGSNNLRQDEDVLDTWFSSWLWPFSTLGWPNKNKKLDTYYPTTTLVTAYDIIFFWVSRMIMAGLEFTNKAPFKDIVIHQLVRDKKGRKMSKSLGNGIDPLDIVNEYGADALKFTLSYMAAQGTDILIDNDSFKFGAKFANKIWNASKYILMNIEDPSKAFTKPVLNSPIQKWIYHRLNQTILAVDSAIASYKFNDASHAVYEFFWNDFCDWYIEASKESLYGSDFQAKSNTISILLDLLISSLKLLHPFLPFVSEKIYQHIMGSRKGDYLITSDYPSYSKEFDFPKEAEIFSTIQTAVRSIRTIRSEFTIPPEKKISAAIILGSDFPYATSFTQQQSLIGLFTNSEISIYSEGDNIDKGGAVGVANVGFEILVFVKDIIDVQKEKAKLLKELAGLEKLYNATKGKLSNSDFLKRAPEDVIKKEEGKLEEFTTRIKMIKGYLSQF